MVTAMFWSCWALGVQTNHKLFLIMDFVNGGHLFFQLYRQGMFSEDLARFFCAEIVLAVEYMHNLKIAHRDLKPENILLRNTGHLIITDFGTAKVSTSPVRPCPESRLA